jgi:hypothetical protein
MTTAPTTTTAEESVVYDEDISDGSGLEDLDEEEPDEFLPTFASFSQVTIFEQLGFSSLYLG